MIKLILLSICALLTLDGIASTRPSCFHPQSCGLLKELNLAYQEISFPNVDPHHFRVGPSLMKKLLTHKLLVLPTGGSFVWTQAIIEKRKKQGLKTLEVDFTEHFWLNPFAYCDSLKDLSKKLEKNFSSVQCLEKAKELKARMQRLIKNKSLILQHSGLDSFLKILGQSYFVLSSGHHHSEMSAHKVKKLLKYLGSRPKIIWVKEQGLEDQYLIDKFKRPEDIIINYHPFRFEKGRSPLESFLEELAKAEQKR